MDKDEYKRLFLIQQITATIFSLSNKLQSKGDNYCEDITVRQIMGLIAILHLPDDKATINNIAKKLTSTKQSTKHIIDSLEKKKYVEVKPSKMDKRSVNVTITKLGRETLRKTIESVNNFFKDVSSNLSIEEMENVWGLLKKIYSFDGNEMDGFEEEVSYKLINKE